MEFVLYMTDKESGRQIELRQSDVEYLGDLAEVLLAFVKACGYTYAGRLTIEAEDGSKEWSSL